MKSNFSAIRQLKGYLGIKTSTLALYRHKLAINLSHHQQSHIFIKLMPFYHNSKMLSMGKIQTKNFSGKVEPSSVLSPTELRKNAAPGDKGS